MESKKVFYSNFIKLALPMALQSAITTFVSLVDNVMVGQLGDVPIAAVGLANKIFFIYTVTVFGMCGGTSAFVTQYFGKKDFKGIKQTVFINMMLSVIVSIIFFTMAFMFPEGIMKLLSEDTEVIRVGAEYLKITSFCYIFTGITVVCSYCLKNMEHPKIPLFGSMISIAVNATLNYVLIFGKFGAPALGSNGAAYATVTARFFEVTFVLFFALKRFSFFTKNLEEYREIPKSLFKTYFKNAIPVTCNEMLWSVGTTVIAAIYARVSTQAIAAVNIVNILFDVSSIFLYGASHAAGIVIGKEIGKKEYEKAYVYTDRLSRFVPLVSGIFGFLLIALCPQFLNLFKVSDEVRTLTFNLYIVMAVYIPFRAFNHLHIVGSLRNGGDVIYCFICDVGALWGAGVLGAYITGELFKLPMLYVYIVSQGEEIVKATMIYLRLRKRNWIKDLVN